MIFYILKTIGCLSFMLVFYHFFLEREKMHSFNRFYLLGSVVVSFIIPLYTIETSILGITEPVAVKKAWGMEEAQSTSADYLTYLGYIWLTITAILSIRFLKNLWNLITIIRTNEKVRYKNATLVLVQEAVSPYTFWNYIFIHKEEYDKKQIEEELFTHELTHVTQKHTLDVLFLELLLLVFWFNPIFYRLKKYVQLNHEFLADQHVIHLHKNISEYQYLLINKTAWNNKYYLASNFNYSLTKKRLVMMTTKSSKSKILLKKIAVVPLIAGFTFVFAERVVAQKTKANLTEVAAKKDKVKDVRVYKDKVTYTYESGKTIVKKLSQLTAAEKQQLPAPPPKNTIGFIPKNDVPPPPPPKPMSVEKHILTESAPKQNGKLVTKPGKDAKTIYYVEKKNGKTKSVKSKANFPVIQKGDRTNIPPPKKE